jgi:hypothetical protein
MRVLKCMKVKVGKHNIKTLNLVIHKGKNIVKRATPVNGHSLKLYFCIFERSQNKHNNMDYHFFWNILH